MIRLFVGSDPRESVGLHVFIQSVLDHTKEPVCITPLTGHQGEGTNAFNLSRFMVPELCGYEGFAIWADGSDMLMRADIAELWALRSKLYAAQVVKHNYTPMSPRKYIGTEMEADNIHYPRKNWSSLIIWNCGSRANRMMDGNLHRFAWLDDEDIGDLPAAWNWLDEYGENPDAKLVHHTNGIPGFAHYANAPHAQEWRATLRRSQRGLW